MVPLLQAISFIVAWIPTVVLESMCYCASIYTIECDLPCEYGLHLLARLKYIIFTKYNTELISKSWDDFMNCLRYFVLFKAKFKDMLPTIGQYPDFNPDYTIRTVHSRPAPKLDQAFEFGILEGARALINEVLKMP